MTDSEKLARIFRVMSVDTRVRMIQLLKRRCLCVNALAHSLGLTPAAISQHLRVLRDAGIVRADKRGYFVHYCVDKKTLARWRDVADDMLGPHVARGNAENDAMKSCAIRTGS